MYAQQYDKELGTLINDYQLMGGTPISDALRASDTAGGPGGQPTRKIKKKKLQMVASGGIWDATMGVINVQFIEYFCRISKFCRTMQQHNQKLNYQVDIII